FKNISLLIAAILVAGQANAAHSAGCTLLQLPSTFATTLTTFNAPGGSGALYGNNFGFKVSTRLATIMGQQMVAVAVGKADSTVEVFFLDPSTGAVLDSPSGQSH